METGPANLKDDHGSAAPPDAPLPGGGPGSAVREVAQVFGTRVGVYGVGILSQSLLAYLLLPAGRGVRGEAAAQETKRVVGLDLSGVDINGRLPAALGSPEKLVWLRLKESLNKSGLAQSIH